MTALCSSHLPSAIFAIIPDLLKSPSTPSTMKAFLYRCINLLVSSLVHREKVCISTVSHECLQSHSLTNAQSIDPNKVILRESYHAFAVTTIRSLRCLAGDLITPLSVPGLKSFV